MQFEDFRYGLRQLQRRPGFTAVIVATLALGIGGNTAIFSVLHALLLRPLPYREPDRLVTLWQKDPSRQQKDKVTAGDYVDWKAKTQVFEDLAYSWDASFTLTEMGNPQTLNAYQFSSNFFSLLGTPPFLGRTFLPEEGQPGRDRVAVLSYRLWAGKFGADPHVIGRAIRLDGNPYTIVGVMPVEFAHPRASVDLWTPLPFPNELAQNRGLHVFQVVARLKSGVTLAQAQSVVDAAELEPIRDTYVGDVRPALGVLQAAVFFMLLIACANVGNMLLAHASATERDRAIRLALGASRWRLFSQNLTQGLLLSFGGAMAGTLVAAGGVVVLPYLFRDQFANLSLPHGVQAWMNWPVMIFTFLIALAAGSIFAAIPVTRNQLPSQQILKSSARGGTGGTFAIRLRNVLVVLQVAFSLVLLAGAGLLIRSFLRLQERSFGFKTDHVLTFLLPFAPNRYSGLPRTAPFLEQTMTNIRAVPGVDSVAAMSTLPLTGMDARRRYFTPGESPDANLVQYSVQYRVATPDYFRVMRIPLKRGRFFNDSDRQDSSGVVIINEKLARRLFPDTDPIGKTLTLAEPIKPEPREIIGVVGDVRHDGLTSEPPIEVYRPAYQAFWPFLTVVVRTAVDPERVVDPIRQAVWAVDKDQPINNIRTVDELAADSVALRRASMSLLGVFAGLALLLTAIGIHGVISYSVILRTREIGVRIALGAGSGDVLKTVLGHYAALTLAGIAAGLTATFGLTRYLAALLYGVTSTDAPALGLAIAVMFAVAAGAAYVPARRASRVDPMVALRDE